MKDSPLPTDFPSALPGVCGRSFLVAAFALFEEARLTVGAPERDAFIAFANNYLAWCEQYDIVQPAFTPPTQLEGEPQHRLGVKLTVSARAVGPGTSPAAAGAAAAGVA